MFYSALCYYACTYKYVCKVNVSVLLGTKRRSRKPSVTVLTMRIWRSDLITMPSAH